MNYKETIVDNWYTLFPNNMNRHNTLFGGQILYWLDEVTGIVIRKYTNLKFFTASIDSYQFLDTVYLNEILVIKSYISHVGNRSVEIFAEISAFNHDKKEKRLVGISFSTFAIKKEEILNEKLSEVVGYDKYTKFVSDSYYDRKNGVLNIREFCKLYKEYYNEENIDKKVTI